MSAPGFDRERYRREQIRDLRADVESLRGQRAKLERVLAVLLRVATGGTSVEPLALLGVIEELVDYEIASERRHELALRLLRETRPPRRRGLLVAVPGNAEGVSRR